MKNISRGKIVALIGLAILTAGIILNKQAQGIGENPPDYLYSIASANSEESSTALTKLNSPLGTAIGPKGQVFVLDTGNALIKVFDQKGKAISSFGSGILSYPVGVLCAQEKLFVADISLDKVIAFDLEGRVGETIVEDLHIPSFSKAVRPAAITMGVDGYLYLADVANQQIVVLEASGKFVRSFGAPPRYGSMQFPNGLAIDKKGRIFVADSNNGRILIFDSQGQVTGEIGTGTDGTLALPRGLAITESGYLLVADVLKNTIVAYDGNSKKIWEIGKNGGGKGEFKFPNGVTLDKLGRLYVTDRENNRVQVFGS